MKKIKIITVFIILICGFVLIKNNVTATKEKKPMGSSLRLEITSELVQSLYSKLNLLQDLSLQDSEYKNMYFKFEDDKKERFSTDEKLYLAFENLYKNTKTSSFFSEDGIEIIRFSEKLIEEQIYELFNEEVNLNDFKDFKTSSYCGVVTYSHDDNNFELGYSKCENTEKRRAKLVSAVKRGNYIDLTVKAFCARTNKIYFEDEDEVFAIRNYNDNNILGFTSLQVLNNDYESIFKDFDIQEYTFSFELKGEDYYLSKILLKKTENATK